MYGHPAMVSSQSRRLRVISESSQGVQRHTSSLPGRCGGARPPTWRLGYEPGISPQIQSLPSHIPEPPRRPRWAAVDLRTPALRPTMMNICRYGSEITRSGRESAQNHRRVSRHAWNCFESIGIARGDSEFFLLGYMNYHGFPCPDPHRRPCIHVSPVRDLVYAIRPNW